MSNESPQTILVYDPFKRSETLRALLGNWPEADAVFMDLPEYLPSDAEKAAQLVNEYIDSIVGSVGTIICFPDCVGRSFVKRLAAITTKRVAVIIPKVSGTPEIEFL